MVDLDNPSVLATTVEQNIPVVWVIMNNNAFGTIAGLTKGAYQHTFGTEFHTPDGKPYNPDWAAVAQAYGVKGVRIRSAEEFKGVFEEAINANIPYVIDVPMENIPVPTDGIWNINDIYNPKENVLNGKLIGGEATKSQHVNTSR